MPTDPFKADPKLIEACKTIAAAADSSKAKVVPLASLQDKPPTKPRITVIDKVYFQSPNQQPMCLESNFTRNLGTDEQPYLRRCKTTDEYKALDLGWMTTDCGMLVIRNDSKPGDHKTDDDRKAATLLLSILVGVGGAPAGVECLQFAAIPPGESCRFTPTSLSHLRIRSPAGNTPYTLGLMPR